MNPATPLAPEQLVDGRITLVDVGARNGMTDLRSIAHMVDAYGFEPSPDEFRKLEGGITDLDRAMPGFRPRYASERYFPYALTDHGGETRLHVTRGIGASSTIEPNIDFLRRFERNGWREKFQVVSVERVPCRTLAEFVAEAGLESIDLLKLDTQGNEYEILDSPAVLSRIGVVKAEVEFVPLYKGQRLVEDVYRMMRSQGFVPFDLRFERIHYRGQVAEDIQGGLLSWGDAYFVNENWQAPDQVRRQCVVLFELGNDDLAFYLARSRAAMSEEQLGGVAAWFASRRTQALSRRQRFKRFLERRLGVSVSRVAR